MIDFIKKKYFRFFESKNILKINFIIQKYFKENDTRTLDLDFSDKPSRAKIIQSIINEKNYKSYLEIGCWKNDLFNEVQCQNKVGVDPVSGGTIRKTSDDFFKHNKLKFDCIFIDGVHKYHQVKKDIINSINAINTKGIIILHDCLPSNVYAQAIPRCQFDWNGDIWKVITEFRTHKDLDIYTCYADQGIGVIFNRSNRNLLEIQKVNFIKMSFKDYFNNYKKYMNLINYHELMNIVKDY